MLLDLSLSLSLSQLFLNNKLNREKRLFNFLIMSSAEFISQIREDVKSGVYVENLTEECVSTMTDVTQILMKVYYLPLPANMFT